MADKKDIEVVRGSGNVFRDFEELDADVRQTKAILAAQIIGILEDRELSTRKAQALTGVDQSDFTRIRNARLGRFTIDRLMTILNKFDQHVEIKVKVRPMGNEGSARRPAAGVKP